MQKLEKEIELLEKKLSILKQIKELGGGHPYRYYPYQLPPLHPAYPPYPWYTYTTNGTKDIITTETYTSCQ